MPSSAASLASISATQSVDVVEGFGLGISLGEAAHFALEEFGRRTPAKST